MDLPVCYTPLWVSPSDKPVDDRLVNSCQVLRYQYIYYMPLWAHVHVMTVDVLMLVNHVWLVAISHALQVFTCDVLHIHIRQHIIGMRIQGDMHDRLFRSDVWRKVSLEITQGIGDARLSRTIIEDLVRCQELSLFLVNLLTIVCQCAIQ